MKLRLQFRQILHNLFGFFLGKKEQYKITHPIDRKGKKVKIFEGGNLKIYATKYRDDEENVILGGQSSITINGKDVSNNIMDIHIHFSAESHVWAEITYLPLFEKIKKQIKGRGDYRK